MGHERYEIICERVGQQPFTHSFLQKREKRMGHPPVEELRSVGHPPRINLNTFRACCGVFGDDVTIEVIHDERNYPTLSRKNKSCAIRVGHEPVFSF